MLEIDMSTKEIYFEENPKERDYQLNLKLRPLEKYKIREILEEPSIEDFYLSDEKERKQLLEK